MIDISTATATTLYLCLTIGFLLVVWLMEHYSSTKKKIILAKEELLVCEFCHFAYLADRSKQVTQCPQCLSYNKDNLYKPKRK